MMCSVSLPDGAHPPTSPSADAHLHALLDSLRDGAAFFTPDLRYVRLNAAHARENGLDVSAHLGRTPGEVLPSLGYGLERALNRVLSTAGPHDVRLTGETPARPGVLRTWDVTLRPALQPDGVLAGVSAVFVGADEFQGVGTGAHTSQSSAPSLAAQLYGVVIGLTAAQTVQEVVRVILSQAFPVTGAFVGGVSVLEPDGQHLRVLGTTGYDAATVRAWPAVPLSLPIPMSVAVQERRGLFLTPSDLQREFPDLADTPLYANQARVTLPLMVGDVVVGGMDFGFEPRGPFSAQERELLLALADACAHVLTNVQQLEQDRGGHEALMHTTAILDAVYEHAPTPFALVDARLQLLRVNPAFARMAGREMGELTGQKLTRALPEWSDLALAAGQVRDTKREVTRTMRQTADGTTREVTVRCHPVLTPSGALIGVGCILLDSATS